MHIVRSMVNASNRGTLHTSGSDEENHWLVRGIQDGFIKFSLHIFPTRSNRRRQAEGWKAKVPWTPLDIANFQFFGIL